MTVFKYILLWGLSICIFCNLQAQVTVTTDRPNARYEAGETAYFRITMPSWANAPVQCTIAHDRTLKPLLAQTLNIAPGGTATVAYRLEEPGTLFCYANLYGQVTTAQAVFSPHRIQALEAEPEDFDAFWNNQRAQLARVPIDPQITLMYGTLYSNTYRINLGMIDGRRVYGFMSVPTGQGPFPAVVQFPAFGATPVIPPSIFTDELGAIVLSISIHNTEADQWVPDAYQPDDPTDPAKMYYRYAILGGLRAVEYLFTRPDFDKQQLGLSGESQGGGLATMVAGLDGRVSVVVGSLNALSEHAGWKYNKASAFPNYLSTANTKSYGNKDFVEKTLRAVKYYDAQYFAKRYAGPTFTCIAYLDEVSPAATIFPMLTVTRTRKTVLHALRVEHTHPNSYWQMRSDAIRRYLPSTRNPKNPFVNPTLLPVADAGDDLNAFVGAPITLEGQVFLDSTADNHLPVRWELMEGPTEVSFENPQARITKATFSTPGEYILRFSAYDESALSTRQEYLSLHDFVKVTVDGNGVSRACNLKALASELICQQNGTLANAADDTWRFTLTVQGTYVGRNGWKANVNGNTISGRYGIPITIDAIPFQGPVTVSLTDKDSTRCTYTLSVNPPTPCAVPREELADIVMVGFSLNDPPPAIVGAPVPFTITLFNAGKREAAGGKSIDVFLSNNPTLDRNDVLATRLRTPNMAAGGVYTIQSNVQINQAGTYYLIAVADADDQLEERVETNNQSSPTKVEVVAPPVTEYCSLSGVAPWEEWINAVAVGPYVHYSGKEQYADFTRAMLIDIEKGVPTSITLTAAFSYWTWAQHWKVWIDFNRNNVFDEPNELVFSGLMPAPPAGFNSGVLSGNFVIPSSVAGGLTRMRVAMQRQVPPPSCGLFERGEVEDYTVRLSGGNSVVGGNEQGRTAANASIGSNQVTVFPNPATDQVQVRGLEQVQQWRLFSQTGVLVRAERPNTPAQHDLLTVPLTGLPFGVYLLEVETPNGRFQTKVVCAPNE